MRTAEIAEVSIRHMFLRNFLSLPNLRHVRMYFNPRRTYRFSTFAPAEGGGVTLTVWPLIELEHRGKKRACRVLRDAAIDT